MNEIKIFSEKRDRKAIKKDQKKIASDNLYKFYDGREMVLNGFKSKILSIKSKESGILNTDHSKLKILTPKQMLRRLPIALAEIKAGNNSENLLNEIQQITYSLY